MLKRNICLYDHESTKDYSAESMSAWCLEKGKWTAKDFPLKVKFVNDCPRTWKCTDSSEILRIANASWGECFTDEQEIPPREGISISFEGTIL